MCKESVKEFTDFILAYCPSQTKIVSTKEVHNTFANKKMLTSEDSEFEDMPFQDIPDK